MLFWNLVANPSVLDAEAYGMKSTVADLTRFLSANLGTVDMPKDVAAAISGTHVGYFETRFFTQDLIWEQYPWPVEADRLKARNSSEMALKVQHVKRLGSPLKAASYGVSSTRAGRQIASVPMSPFCRRNRSASLFWRTATTQTRSEPRQRDA